MKKVGELPWGVRSYNTCEYRGRIFNFVSDYHGELLVRELLLGDEVEVKEVDTGVDWKCRRLCFLSHRPFNDKILLMAGEDHATDFFCALVSVDPGDLTKDSIHIEEKNAREFDSYSPGYSPIPPTEGRARSPFDDSNEMRADKSNGNEVAKTRHHNGLPDGWMDCTPSLRLPDGRLLLAGGWPYSTQITLVTPGEQLSLEKIGNIPGEGRRFASTILINERFVVGFGGQFIDIRMDDMWIFDLKTRRSSRVTKRGEWHPASQWCALVVRDDNLYILGGDETASAHCLSFSTLVRLIPCGRVRCAFCSCLGFPFRPGKGFKRNAFSHYIPLHL